MKIERPELLEKLKKGMKSPLIKVIIGIRRCGKSYLLFEIFYDYLKSTGIEEDHIIRIKLDELSNAALRNPILTGHTSYCLLVAIWQPANS